MNKTNRKKEAILLYSYIKILFTCKNKTIVYNRNYNNEEYIYATYNYK